MTKNYKYMIEKRIEFLEKKGVDTSDLNRMLVESDDLKLVLKKARSMVDKIMPVPTVGELMTIHIGSDRRGGVVTSVLRKGKQIQFKLNRSGGVRTANRDSEGSYYEGSSPISFGFAQDYDDPSF